MEVSLVQEGNRPNCHILAVVADEDLKKWMAEKTNGASPSTPQTPPAQSPPGTPPAQAQGQPSDALIPGNLDSSLVGDISKIRKEHLTKISPEELQNVTMVALMKVQEMAGELQKFDQYKKERDVEERKRRDADNEAYYNYIKQFQDQNKADHFKQMYQELTTGKDWSELEKQGRLNSIVLANFSKMSETIAAKDKELEMWKKRSAPSSEPEDVASFITRAVTSASYPTKKQRFETSDIERAEKKPATPSMNPNYNPNAPTQQLVSGNQAPPSDDVQAMISRMYKGLQGPLTRPQGGNIGVPDPTRR